jgi:quercetin dioxygenase-like cupin family protein
VLDRVVTWRDTEVPDEVTQVRVGSVAKPRDFIDRERGVAFRIHTAEHPEDFFSPRHRHTFDQVRYMISGSCRYGKRTYVAGDCLYIPAGVTYGPMQLALNKENFKHFNMQYQGVGQIHYYPPTAFDAARERLHNRGRFDHGVFIWNDGRKEDAFQVLLQETTGKPVVYPEPPTEDYIVVRSRNLAWRPADGLPGVEVKYLGHFTEVGPNMQVVKLAPGTRTPPGQAPYQQVRCLIGGTVRFEDAPGEAYGETTLRYIPPGVAYGATECVAEATFLVVSWAPDGAFYHPEIRV